MLFNNPPIRYLIAAEFLAVIATREAAILQRLYDGTPRPFEYSGNEKVSGGAVLRRLVRTEKGRFGRERKRSTIIPFG